jgi:hypothetical protein
MSSARVALSAVIMIHTGMHHLAAIVMLHLMFVVVSKRGC